MAIGICFVVGRISNDIKPQVMVELYLGCALLGNLGERMRAGGHDGRDTPSEHLPFCK